MKLTDPIIKAAKPKQKPYPLSDGKGLTLYVRPNGESWVNISLPNNSNKLSKVLGLDVNEVDKSLPAVMPFFAVVDGVIISPELEDFTY